MRRSAQRLRAHLARRKQKSLHFECLEQRQLLDAGGLAAVSSAWFGAYLDASQPQHAGSPALSARVLASSTAASIAADSACDWIVQFNTAALSGIASAAESVSLLAGGGIDFTLIEGLGCQGQVLVRSHGAAAQNVAQFLRGDSHVASFEQDAVRQFEKTPNDASYSKIWSLHNTGQTGGTAGADINAQAAWDIATGSRNVVVAVIDTGVDFTHSDLAANIWTNPGETAGNGADDDGNGLADDVHGYNFVSDTGNCMDDNGHGTHVAGTIGATGNNGQGVAGINWSVSIMALKFLDASGSGYTSDAVRAINYATLMKTRYNVNLRVANCSWGGGGSSAAVSNAIQAAGDAGILFAVAAGNNGTNNDVTPQYPANYNLSNVITVAATDASDNLAAFSCYGATTVQIAAPGVGIYSTVPGGYASYSGTSMATPQVAGVAALAFAANPNATVAQVRSAILQGADRLGSLSGKVSTGGRLDAYNTLRLIAPGGPQNPDTPAAPSITALTLSPSTVQAGGGVTLTAIGITSSSTLSSVSFYQDTNGNGTWDSSDRLLGFASSVVNGQASMTLSTSGWSAGSYRLLVRAVDARSQASNVAVASLSVVAPSKPGTTLPSAIAVAVGSTVSARISTSGEINWFKFQAVAGKSYVMETTLGSLADTILALYGQDGKTVLSWNDDIGAGSRASRVAWLAPSSGTYYVGVSGFAGLYTGTYSLRIAQQNAAPALAAIANQVLQRGSQTTVSLSASDPDGDTLRLTTATNCKNVALSIVGNKLTIRPAATYTGSFLVYVTASDGVNTITRSFTVTVNAPAAKRQNASPTLAAIANQMLQRGTQATVSLSASDPNGDALQLITATNCPNVALSIAGNRLTIRPSATYTGSFQVYLTASDGIDAATRSFTVTVNAPAGARQSGSSGVPQLPTAGRGSASLAAEGTAGAQTLRTISLRAVDAVLASWRP